MKVIGTLKAILGLDKTKFDRGLDQAEAKTNRFSVGMKRLAGVMAAAFGAVVGALGAVIMAMKSTEGTADKLDFAIATLKGGFQGLMKTIVTGDWYNLIDNITKTAKATRDLKIAWDELADIQASNYVRMGQLERSLQAARVAAAASIDPKLKAQYLQEAINLQKSITSIQKGEIEKRMIAYENSFKTLMGFDEKTSELMIANIRKLAGNYETFFGEGGQYALLQIEKETLASKELMGTLTKVEAAHYRQVRAAVANLGVMQELRNTMKPEAFNEYIKSVGDYYNAIAEGDQSLIRLTQSFTNQEQKLNDAKEAVNEYKEALDRLYDTYKDMYKKPVGEYAQSTTPFSYEEIFKKLHHTEILGAVNGLTNDLQKQQITVDLLTNAFETLFTSTEDGFKNMIDSIIMSLKRLLAELMAKIVVLTLLNVLTRGGASFAAILKSAAGLGSVAKGEAGGTVPPGYPRDTYPALLSSGETILSARESRNFSRELDVHVTGDIMGRAIALVGRRTEKEN